MKRKMISVLALTLILLMSVVLVSCEDFKPVASDAIAEEVVDDTLGFFTMFYEPIEYLVATGERTKVQDGLELAFDIILLKEWGAGYSLTVDVPDVKTISVKAASSDGKQKIDVSITGLAATASAKINGDFDISTNIKDSGAASAYNIAYKGNFSLATIASNSSITYSYVSYKGTEYDLEKFNSKMSDEIKTWNPELT